MERDAGGTCNDMSADGRRRREPRTLSEINIESEPCTQRERRFPIVDGGRLSSISRGNLQSAPLAMQVESVVFASNACDAGKIEASEV